MLHFPNNEKGAKFNEALQRKLDRKDFNFAGVWFPNEMSFQQFDFSAEVDFRSATFNAAAFFSSATFRGAAYFFSATFSAAADFSSATFGGWADFSSATFSAAAYFRFATFSAEAYFRDATFADRVRFAGDGTRHIFTGTSLLDLQFARIEKPDHFSFHTISLRPHWFVNVEARKFDFTNVDWGRRSIDE